MSSMTRDVPTPSSHRPRGSHKKARPSRSLPVMERVSRETPYQDYVRIKRMIQAKAELKGELGPLDLFIDPSFPPDRSSLTYVYSGEDRYERAVFQRPKDVNSLTLSGVGGICDEAFPWQHWKQRGWFQAALAVVCLSVQALDRLIPGLRKNEQNFGNGYIGCFHFNLWRFGEWVDIVVDDYLPMLDDRPLFSKPMGEAREMWGPLVEKAYAKCKKTFQAMEYGFTLDALTDLTGAVCEFFTPDVDPPSNLFHLVYKSGTNRSFMVCWRNNKRLTPAGFNWTGDKKGADTARYLHVVTSITKFPTSDGRMEQMIRLKCPYPAEPTWGGRFSDGDVISWQNINSEFMSRLSPRLKKDSDEYWMTFSDFRCNFGGLFIISSPEPFRLDGLSMTRIYRQHSDTDSRPTEVWTEVGYRNRRRRLTAPYEIARSDFSKRRTNSDSECHGFILDSFSAPCTPHKSSPVKSESLDVAIKRKLFVSRGKDPESNNHSTPHNNNSKKGKSAHKERALFYQRCQTPEEEKSHQDVDSDSTSTSGKTSSSCLPSPRRRKSTGEKLKDLPHLAEVLPGEVQEQVAVTSFHLPVKTPRSKFMKKHSLDTSLHGLSASPFYSGSMDTCSEFVSPARSSPVWATSHSPGLPKPEDHENSTPVTDLRIATSEQSAAIETTIANIPPHPLAHFRWETSHRPHSAPGRGNIIREASFGSLNSLTQNIFLAPKADYFRPDGRWRIILEHKDFWNKDRPSSDRTCMDIHSRTLRVYFLVTRQELKDPLIPPTLQDKRHVLISLMQDYRHGPSTANSLLVPIGFCLYKTKHSDRDDRRHISKLQLIGQIESQPDRREVTARFDLDPGGYFIVPYYQAEQHQGEYLLRVLADGDMEPVKTGCKIS